MIRDRYLRILAIMLLVATVINTTGEYVIGKMATDRSAVYAAEQAATPETAAMTPDARAVAVHDAQERYISTFYSDYYALVNLLSALLQALLVARLLGDARDPAARCSSIAAGRVRRLVRGCSAVREPDG